MKELSKYIYIIAVSFISFFVFLGCNEDGTDEPLVNFTNPKIESLIDNFTTYLRDSSSFYKGNEVISIWIKQRASNNYLIAIYNDIPAECEKRVGVLYQNGFKVYVLITTDIEKQTLVQIKNVYSKKSKKECQKWVDRYLKGVNESFFINDHRAEEGVFDFINDTLYFIGTSYLFDGFGTMDDNG